ncbi:MerR family transcriptional regulator [Marinomonas algicola]|uniref:MerR family transcriptional regulator n=1 Tax=Marinomonas algicola TaxID=2773454 RepID=UPI0017492CAB|nr:MerR family transcriptional regulator [Marinomonas algicola]
MTAKGLPTGRERSVNEMLFPIRELSLKTGINSVTLRAWERRYGLLKPVRTEKGHRLYSEMDVQRVKDIVSWINKGIAVSKVRALLEQDTVETNRVEQESGTSNEWQVQQSALLMAIERFQEDKIDALIQQNLSQYPIEVVIHYWLSPVLSHLQNAQTSAALSYFIALLKQRINTRLVSKSKNKFQKKVLLISLEEDSSIWVWLQAAWCSDKGCHVVVLDSLQNIEDSFPLIKGIQPDAFIAHLDKSFGQKKSLIKAQLQEISIPLVICGASIWLEENQSTAENESASVIFSDPFDGVRHLLKQIDKNV